MRPLYPGPGRRNRRGADLPRSLDRVALFRPGADAAVGDVGDLVESLALQDRGGEAAALAAAADRGDRAIAGDLVEAVGNLAVGDVERSRDVATLPLVLVADVEDDGGIAVAKP